MRSGKPMAKSGSSRKRAGRGRRGRGTAPRRREAAAGADLLRHAYAAHQRGQLALAEEGYRAYLEHVPGDADALHNLGLVYFQTGRASAALAPLEAAAGSKADDAALALALGYVHRELGQIEAADAALSRALALGGVEVEARLALGTVRQAGGDVDGAIACFEAVLEREPRHAGAWNSLGSAYLDREEHERALQCFDQALAMQPDHLLALSNRGQALDRLDRPDEALASLDRAIALRPGFPEALNNRASVLWRTGRREEAAQACADAIRARPGYVGALFKLGCIRAEQARLAPAARAFRDCLAHDPGHVGAHIELASVLIESGEIPEGKALALRSLELAPHNPGAHVNLGTALAAEGDDPGARGAFEKALELEPRLPAAWLHLSRMKRFTEADEPVIAEVERLSSQPGYEDRAAASWGFALGKMHHDRGRYGEAFRHYAAANARMRRVLEFNPGQFDAHVEAVRRVMSRAFFDARQGFGIATDTPVFVFGMPRSGTTLVEQVLASHPQVHGGGELRNLPELATELDRGRGAGRSYVDTLADLSAEQCARHAGRVLEAMCALAPQAARVTDKLPGNYLHLGLLALMFPRAHFVHCRRDPMDVCLSNFTQLFAEGHHYSYSLAHLGHVYRVYHDVMSHWAQVLPIEIHEVRYEDMVGDQEATSRRLVAACGLEWDDRCLAFNENRRDVSTASVWQVRQPIYRSAVERWRRYEPYLDELREALGDLAPPPASRRAGAPA